MTYPIIKNRNIWFVLSGLLVVASLSALLMYPLRLGIDFTGGSLMEVTFEERPVTQTMRDGLADIGFSEAVVQTTGENGMLIRMAELDEETHQFIFASLQEKYGEVSELRFESIGPSIGAELRQNAIWSLVMVLIGIALYVAYAFRKVSRPVSSWKYALVTLIAALLHDVLVPLGVFALLGHFLLVELNSGFVAAVLTILGFSVHDTIVVFDRIRENLLRSGGEVRGCGRTERERDTRALHQHDTHHLVPVVGDILVGRGDVEVFRTRTHHRHGCGNVFFDFPRFTAAGGVPEEIIEIKLRTDYVTANTVTFRSF